jgi:hypothetical protein
MAEQAVANGANPLFQNNVTYIVVLWGGLTHQFPVVWLADVEEQNLHRFR